MPELRGVKISSRFASRTKVVSILFGAAATALTAGIVSAAPGSDTTEIQENVYTFSFAGNFLAARLARKEKDISRAADFYRRALNADPGNLDLLGQSFVLSAANGDIEEAAELARQLLAVNPGNSLARLVTIVDAYQRSDYEAADKLLSTRPSRRLDRLTHGIIGAWMQYERGHPKDAAKRLAGMGGAKWITSNAAYHGGLLQILAGDYEKAAELLKRAHEEDPNVMRMLMAYAEALARMGKYDEALAAIGDFKRKSGTHALIEDLEKRLAEKRLPEPVITSARGGAAEILYHIGSAIARDGQEVAAAYLQLSQRLEANAILPKIVLAGLYERFKMHARAIDLLNEIPASSPLHMSAQVQVGLHYNSLENLKAARKHLSAIVDADPANLLAVRIYATVLRNHKLFADAAKVLEQGIATIGTPGREHWLLYYHRGICYERTDRWALAEADFQQALELFPDQPHVLNYLGYSWIDKGMHLEKALEMIKLAVAKRSDDGYIVDSLGWAYYRLRQYDKAVEHLERAVELRPEDPVINDHLGDAYWRAGRHLEARFQWNHARDLKPEPDVLKIVLRKIAKGMEEEKALAPKPESDGKKDG